MSATATYADDLTDAPAGISALQNRLNLMDAADFAANEVGILEKPRAEWTQADFIAYMKSFRDFILRSPDMFTMETVAVAGRINPDAYYISPGDRADASFGLWVTDTIAPAARSVGAAADLYNGLVDALSNLGKAISNTSKASPFLIPIAVAVFGYFFVRAVGSDPGGQAGKVIRAVRNPARRRRRRRR